MATIVQSNDELNKGNLPFKVADATNDDEAVNLLQAKNGELFQIGVGQTWQNVSDDRDPDVTYTNTTGKPILVAMGGYGNDSDRKAYIDDVEHFIYSSGSIQQTALLLVPAGSTYKRDSLDTRTMWLELR